MRILLMALVFSSYAMGQTRTNQTSTIQSVTNVPVSDQDTAVATLRARPREYEDRPVTIPGCATVINYYNWGFEHANSTHYSLSFDELTSDGRRTGELTVYVDRTFSRDLVDKITKAQQQGGCKTLHLKVAITSRCFDGGKFHDMVELRDWQFYDKATGQWQEWANAPPPPRRATPEEIAATQAAKKAADEKSLKWHQELADKGYAFGQYHMGLRYLKGDGVPKDLEKAKEYLTKAAAQKDSAAIAELKKSFPP